MSEEKNIKNFTAADIEKYWAGKLSASEMHAMEKAAMDDPFLADAMEGYKNRTTIISDLNTLRERFDKRVIALAPVVPLKQKKFPWLKVAAAVIIVGGIGVLVQQLVFSDRNQSSIVSLDKTEKTKDDAAANNNTTVTTAPATPENQGSLAIIPPDSPSIKTQQKVSNNLSGIISQTPSDTTDTFYGDVANDFKKAEAARKDSISGNPVVSANAKPDEIADKLKEKSIDREFYDTSKFRKANEYKAEAGVAPNAKLYERGDVNQRFGMTFNNKYNYRVVDAQNNPVPFANVMNTRDNVGTYTDIRGNFNLVSSDSVLNVQIKSLGYLSNDYKLVPSSQFNSLTLKEDIYARLQITDSTRPIVSNVTRKDTAELVEPVVGWGYFNTYVANNIKIPENIRKKSTLSNVELSFDIDAAGNPINIKVTKSSKCKECDEEAKRLLKEGPKWKRKGKKSKTTISIAVDQK